MRAGLGAIQNRLESSIRNQSNVAANEADARSRIRDADFAEESANLSQQSIIQQAAASMLMQANTRPQLGLSLLGLVAGKQQKARAKKTSLLRGLALKVCAEKTHGRHELG